MFRKICDIVPIIRKTGVHRIDFDHSILLTRWQTDLDSEVHTTIGVGVRGCLWVWIKIHTDVIEE